MSSELEHLESKWWRRGVKIELWGPPVLGDAGRTRSEDCECAVKKTQENICCGIY